jgi:hypothetical protein
VKTISNAKVNTKAAMETSNAKVSQRTAVETSNAKARTKAAVETSNAKVNTRNEMTTCHTSEIILKRGLPLGEGTESLCLNKKAII